MTETAWHLDAGLVERYADLALAPSARASLEAHLQSCAACHRLVAGSESAARLAARLDRTWAATVDRIDAPRRNWLHRLAAAVGVPDHLARLVAVSGAFRAAWLASIAAAVTAGVLVDRGELGPVAFLLLAPLVPVVGVAAAYGGSTRVSDSRAWELATPFGELRLVLLRTSAVTATSVAVLGALTPLLPAVGLDAVAWLLPALALAAATLALTTRVAPEQAATGVGVGWLATVLTAALLVPRVDRPTATDLGALAWPLQVVAALVLVASVTAFAARRHTIEVPVR